MIAAVTGHTKGIGKSLADYLSNKGYNIVGFSKSNGFDISDVAVREKIVELSSTADVFVNNAYDFKNQILNSQNDLLTRMFGSWRNQRKLIINVSSVAGDFWPTTNMLYNRNKYELDKTMINFGALNSQLTLVNLKPGYVHTEQADAVMPKGTPAMNPNDVFPILDLVFDNLNKIRITSITYKVL